MYDIATKCMGLVRVDIVQMPINDEILIHLATHCFNLYTLHIERCQGVVTESGILSVLNKCTYLSCLRVLLCELEETPVIEVMMRACMYGDISIEIRN